MSRFDGYDAAEQLLEKMAPEHAPAITQNFDPYERIRQIVSRLCIYDPSSDRLICSVAPENRTDITAIRRQLMGNNGMSASQVDNGFCAAYTSIQMEQRRFYEEAMTGINELEVTEAYDG